MVVNKDGRRHPLGDHPPTVPKPRRVNGRWNAPEAIRAAFHALMSVKPAPLTPLNPEPGSDKRITLAELFEKYLDWRQRHREPRTYDGYLWHLQKFVAALGDQAHMPAAALKPFHVVEWLDANPGWGQTYRRNAIGAVKRAYNWVKELGHVAANPVRKLSKPGAKRRERFVRPDDWARVRESYAKCDPFRDLMEFVWETGCRPQEARHIKPRHVRLDKAVVAIPPAEAKGKKRWRLIRLEGPVLALVARRLAHARSKLFTNEDGNPWTSSAVNCRFGRLKAKLGVRFSPYQFRHGFATRLLVRGVDHLTVAGLLGHSDGTMLAKIYQHLDQSDDHLRAALRAGSSLPQPPTDLVSPGERDRACRSPRHPPGPPDVRAAAGSPRPADHARVLHLEPGERRVVRDGRDQDRPRLLVRQPDPHLLAREQVQPVALLDGQPQPDAPPRSKRTAPPSRCSPSPCLASPSPLADCPEPRLLQRPTAVTTAAG